MKPSEGIRRVAEQLSRLESATLLDLQGATKLPEFSLLAFLHAGEAQGRFERRYVPSTSGNGAPVAVWRLKR